MTSDTVLILDWGASHIAAASIRLTRSRRLQVDRLCCEEVDPAIQEESRTIEVARELWGRLARTLGRMGPAVLTLPFPTTTIKTWETADVGASQRKKTLQFEARQALGGAPEDFVWDFRERTREGKRLEVTLVSLPLAGLEARRQVLAAAGFKVERVLPAGLSLQSHLALSLPKFSGTTALVEIGAKATHVALSSGGYSKTRAFALGGNAVTRSLADALEVSFERAEALKRSTSERLVTPGSEKPGDGDVLSGMPASSVLSDSERRVLAQATEHFVGCLHLEITRVLVNERRPGVAPVATRIVLAGGGALLPGLAEALAVRLRLPVEHLKPFSGVETTGGEWLRSPLLCARGTDPIASAAVHFLDPDDRFNLLPPQRIREVVFRKRQPAILGAATLVAVSLVPPLWQVNRAVAVTATKAGEFGAAAHALASIKRRNEGNLARIEAAKAEIVLLRRLAAERGNWVRFFSDLQTKLTGVEDVWLEKIHYVRPSAGLANATPARLLLTGRILEAETASADVRVSAENRVRALLTLIASSPFVAALEHERFDRSEPSILFFEVMVRMNRSETL